MPYHLGADLDELLPLSALIQGVESLYGCKIKFPISNTISERHTRSGRTGDTHMNVRLLILTVPILLVLGTVACPAQSVALHSPNKQIVVHFRISDEGAKQRIPMYDVHFMGTPILMDCELGLDFLKSGILQEQLVLTSTSFHALDETYSVVNGKTATARNHYNEVTISLEETTGLRRRLDVSFRAYDDGIAFRYTLPRQAALDDFVITNELSRFATSTDPTVRYLSFEEYANPHEGLYETRKMSHIDTKSTHIDVPVLLECDDGAWVAITEAALVDYAGLYLRRVKGTNAFESDLTPSRRDPKVKVCGVAPHKSPWRVLMIADNPGALITSNLILNLNEPCRITDTSWIKPGKTTWHWWNGTTAKDVDFTPGMNTATMKHYIDFCAENGIGYHALVDHEGQGWYGKSRGDLENEDMTTATPEIDMQEILRYAKQKGVEMRVWMHWKNAARQMGEAFPLYEQWGIKGFMMDFMDHSDQDMMRFCHQVLELAAKHHLKVQFHGASKPTGLRRTFPYLTNIEGVLNLEYLKWSDKCTPEHNVIVPFTRMLAGPMDYHLGGFRSVKREDFEARRQNLEPVVMGTRCHHLAMYVVYENPVPMVCDYPTAYRHQPGLEFLRQVPTVWDDTKVINAKVSDYITVGRRHGDEWYIGSMTDWTERELAIPLAFLSDREYSATIYSDTQETKKDPNLLKKEQYLVTATDTITAKLGSGGGHVIVLSPVGSESNLPAYSSGQTMSYSASHK